MPKEAFRLIAANMDEDDYENFADLMGLSIEEIQDHVQNERVLVFDIPDMDQREWMVMDPSEFEDAYEFEYVEDPYDFARVVTR